MRACRWLLRFQDAEPMEACLWPPASKEEVERQYSGATVEIRAWGPAVPALADMDLATSWALLIGERDLEVIAPFADESGLGALKGMALDALYKAPEMIIAGLTDDEAVQAATVVVADVDVDPALGRALAPILPAMQGRYGSLENRAAHARRVLTMIAADPPSGLQRATTRCSSRCPSSGRPARKS